MIFKHVAILRHSFSLYFALFCDGGVSQHSSVLRGRARNSANLQYQSISIDLNPSQPNCTRTLNSQSIAGCKVLQGVARCCEVVSSKRRPRSAQMISLWNVWICLAFSSALRGLGATFSSFSGAHGGAGGAGGADGGGPVSGFGQGPRTKKKESVQKESTDPTDPS